MDDDEVAGLRERVQSLERQLQEAQESESLYRAIAETAPDWEFMIAADGRIVHVTAAAENITGYAAQAFRDDPDLLCRITIERDRDFVRSMVLDPTSTIEGRSIEYALVHAKGYVRHIAHISSPVRDSAGRWLGKRCNQWDCTGRLEMAGKLDRASRTLRELLANAPIGVVELALDPDGQLYVVSANRAAELLFDASRGQVVGRAVLDVLPELAGTELVALAQNLAAKGGRAGPIPYEFAGDMVRWVELTGFQTNPNEIVVLFHDITAEREAEAEVRKLNTALEERVAQRTRQLEDTVRELEAFTYSVSHDLRAPLRAVGGFASILAMEMGAGLDDEHRGFLGRIQGAAKDMSDLIDALLSISRLSRAPLAKVETDLSQIAHDIVDRLQAGSSERQVEWMLEDGLTASADPTLIRSALENLLGNAWKFTGLRKAAKITFGREQTADGPAFVVRDNGVGFDMKQADRLFGAFQRLHTADQFPGHGIGLATVQRIVARHGGRVWADARPGLGAAFYFTL